MIRHRFMQWLVRNREPFVITRTKGEPVPYLSRWIFRGPLGWSLFVHYFHIADEDEWLHDHPWPCVGIPVVGGYVEERLTRMCPMAGIRTRKRRIFTFRPNFIGTKTFHRIAKVKQGTWTLFLHGPSTGCFGFLKQRRNKDRFDIIYHQPKDEVIEYARKRDERLI